MNDTAPACRSCGNSGLRTILDLGRTPLANALLDATQLDHTEPTYPLELAFCPHCTLVQLLHSVPPEQLFLDYLYFSSFSDTMQSHVQALAKSLIDGRSLTSASLVMEAASNDGYLLRHYREAGVPVLGIEPAHQASALASARGIESIPEFFTRALAQRLRYDGRRADVFHAHNVLAHVPDLNGFVAGIGLVLHAHGVGIIEVPYVKDLVDHCAFDTIYHEHLCYFSLTALEHLFRRHGLVLEDAQRIDIHGGSLRLTVGHAAGRMPSARVRTLLHEEAGWGVGSADFYQVLADRVQTLKQRLCDLLGKLKRRRQRLAAYGASAKGSTLLNSFGIGRDILDFVVDRSPYKQGRYMPGVRLPIYAPEKLLEAMPDYVLLLTWNFADEIMRQQAEYRRRGGCFITPVPQLRVIYPVPNIKVA